MIVLGNNHERMMTNLTRYLRENMGNAQLLEI